jgi:hypothetical protein
MTLRISLPIAGIAVALSASAVPAQPLGKCRFETARLAFQGTPIEQAQCLLRPVRRFGHVDANPAAIPDVLRTRIGQPVDITREKLKAHLDTLGLTEAQVGGPLNAPLSRANNNAGNAPQARYFVIHDTSSPNFRNNPFPPEVDTNAAINNVNSIGAVAHFVINRGGRLRVAQTLRTPFRATKLESRIGTSAKGLFVHLEFIQPRRSDAAGAKGNDAIAVEPGLSPAQYERLALLYAVASLRSGQWMIPAFHATIDEGLPNAHDDPQNFSLADFAARLTELIARLNN